MAFVEYHHAFDPSFKLAPPYNVALVQLEEGPCLITNIIVDDVSQVINEMPVLAEFEESQGDVTLLKFRPAEKAPAEKA